jgi:predicted dinucleotide-binding enzyme
METIGIIGSGNVGGALASRLRGAGYDVVFGGREPGSTAAAATRAQMLLVAVPSAAAIDAVSAAGDLTGKIIVDCTNPLRWENGPVWAPPAAGSSAAALAAAFPAARVVKGFNHFGVEVQGDPSTHTGPADAFFASDDAEAKARVMALARAMGFEPKDAGPLRNAAVLENLAVLWIHLATVGGAGRQFAFQMVGRPDAARGVAGTAEPQA